MANKSGTERKERTEELIKTLREWQGIERSAIEATSKVMESTGNHLIRQFMEIIRNDSIQHHRVQQFIIDSLTKEAVHLTHEELAEIWDQIEAHDRVEKKTIAMAEKCREECGFFVQRSLLNYLIADEKKHDLILQELEAFKKDMTYLG